MKTLSGGRKAKSKYKIYRRSVVVIDFPDRLPDYLLFAEKLIYAFKNSAYISNPSPSINKVEKDVAKMRDKQAIAKFRKIGTAAARDVVKVIVDTDIYAWAAYVQMLADNDREHSVEIIESSGFRVKRAPVRSKQPLKAVKGKESLSVLLIGASLGRRIAYEWEMSFDGQNWTHLSATNVAKKNVKNLIPAVIYYFRYRGNTSVDGIWSDMIAFITI